MQKRLRLSWLILCWCAFVAMSSQPTLDLTLQRQLRQSAVPLRQMDATIRTAPSLPVLIKSSNAALPPYISATEVTDGVFTARVTPSQLRQLSTDTTLSQIVFAPRHRLLTDRTREATGVTSVQAGLGLVSPFAGRGVLIGVIDEGFEYQHATFTAADGTSRVRYVWNRRLEGSLPTAEIPTSGDGYTATNGHATHVASIAAGRAIDGSNYYGMAPEADLIFIPSNLDNGELLEDVAFLAKVAQEEGKPFVVNVSFGSLDGPHDGRDLYSSTMDTLLRQNHGFMVAAMGNENGNRYHAIGTTDIATAPLRFLLSPSGSEAMIDLWVQLDDSVRHTTIRPFVLQDNDIRYDLVDFSDAFLEEINPDNHKQHANLTISRAALLQNGSYLNVGLEVTAVDAEVTVHAWTDEDYGTFRSPDERFVVGDDNYLVCEGGACVPSAIAVSAYVAGNTTSRLNGSSVSFASQYKMGEICPFSNRGPYLGSEPKPTVAAPGAVVRAAVSKVTPEFSARGSRLVETRTYNGELYYYGYMSGTSMSTPVVTGIVALWLEACPTLTQTQLMDILRTTSVTHDDTQRWGYGAIDAYAGLQAALQYAEVAGLETTRQSDLPFALQRRGNAFSVLACRPINHLSWRICDTSGRTLVNGSQLSLTQATAFNIPISHLPQGIYFLQLVADGKAFTQKFVSR